MLNRKSYNSLEEARVRPKSVRRLWLIKPDVSFEAFVSLLPQLTEAQEIQLGWQSWTELPFELSTLQSLRSLTVLNTPIQKFPGFLTDCPSLVELVLRGTEISVIPAIIQQFRGLRHLDFSNNPILEIVPELGLLPNLQHLQLADNGLRILPDSLAGLRCLRSLGLAGNQFNNAEASRVRNWFPRGVVSISGTDELGVPK